MTEKQNHSRLEKITDELLDMLKEGGDDVPQVGRLLGCLGEYVVRRKLMENGIEAQLLNGNRKSKDLIIEAGLRIEVKTSRTSKVVTRIAQKDFTKGAPDIWVIVSIKKDLEFYVLTHDEIVALQKVANEAWAKKHRERTGEEFDVKKDGVDNLPFSALAQFKGDWRKVKEEILKKKSLSRGNRTNENTDTQTRS